MNPSLTEAAATLSYPCGAPKGSPILAALARIADQDRCGKWLAINR